MQNGRVNPKVAHLNKKSISISNADKEKLKSRMARLLWESNDAPRPMIVSARALSYHQNENDVVNLQSPLVMGSIVAGMVGVIIIAIIIISVWIRSKLTRSGERSGRRIRERDFEHVDADSSVIISSISLSTLDTLNVQEGQWESAFSAPDEWSFYTANDLSIGTSENETGSNQSSPSPTDFQECLSEIQIQVEDEDVQQNP